MARPWLFARAGTRPSFIGQACVSVAILRHFFRIHFHKKYQWNINTERMIVDPLPLRVHFEFTGVCWCILHVDMDTHHCMCVLSPCVPKGASVRCWSLCLLFLHKKAVQEMTACGPHFCWSAKALRVQTNH